MSTSSFFKFDKVIRRLHEGPLGAHIDAYAALLQEQGYTRASACVHLKIVNDLSRWMQRRELRVRDINAETVKQYLHCRRHYVGRYGALPPCLTSSWECCVIEGSLSRRNGRCRLVKASARKPTSNNTCCRSEVCRRRFCTRIYRLCISFFGSDLGAVPSSSRHYVRRI